MNKLKSRIHDDSNGLDYELMGDYYIPALEVPEEHRPIGRWGRLSKPDLNEQAESRLETISRQMKEAEGMRDELKTSEQLVWVQRMNNIRNRAEEIVLTELIYTI